MDEHPLAGRCPAGVAPGAGDTVVGGALLEPRSDKQIPCGAHWFRSTRPWRGTVKAKTNLGAGRWA